MLLFHQEGDHRRIQRPRAGAHQKAVERGQAHRGVDDLAVADRRNGGTIAQMAGDDAGPLSVRLAQQLLAAAADEPVRGAVEPVPPHAVFLIILIRHAEHIRLGGHGLMKGGVEHGHLRNLLAEGGGGGVDALHVGGIMQRGERRIVGNVEQHLLVDEHRAIVFGSALHHAVADGGHLMQIAEHLALARNERLLDLLKGGGVIGHGHFPADHPAVPRFVGELAVDADALAHALGEHLLALHVDELILKGRAACVDD